MISYVPSARGCDNPIGRSLHMFAASMRIVCNSNGVTRESPIDKVIKRLMMEIRRSTFPWRHGAFVWSGISAKIHISYLRVTFEHVASDIRSAGQSSCHQLSDRWISH